MIVNTQTLVLASTSATRQSLLRVAGVSVTARKPEVDETSLLKTLSHLTPPQLAVQLAEAKARSLSAESDATWVIGADQVLEFEGKVTHKASTVTQALQNLRHMSGKKHSLHSAVCVVQNHQVHFKHLATATLHMRELSPTFLDFYAEHAKAALLQSVGGYYVEDLGIQLFENIDGDIHTVMGLPLMPLLAFLRQQGIILS